ncbi:MAG: glycosyltransferase [Pedosphaera sp.]|nr:glycosyltransferase [Pedosphaera sp.]
MKKSAQNQKTVKISLPSYIAGIPVAAPFRLSEEGRVKIRCELCALPEEVVVIISCRLDSWKGHEFLFQALAQVRKGNQWKLWVVGGGQASGDANRRRLLELLAGELGLTDCIRFLGHRDDVWKLLQAADIHCQPNSGPEPFGIAFVEALYAGIPVVSTSIGGALEIVTSDCGILVPPRDSVALATALTGLIENLELRRSLGSAGPSRARLLCDPDQQVAEIERVLLSCSRL